MTFEQKFITGLRERYPALKDSDTLKLLAFNPKIMARVLDVELGDWSISVPWWRKKTDEEYFVWTLEKVYRKKSGFCILNENFFDLDDLSRFDFSKLEIIQKSEESRLEFFAPSKVVMMTPAFEGVALKTVFPKQPRKIKKTRFYNSEGESLVFPVYSERVSRGYLTSNDINADMPLSDMVDILTEEYFFKSALNPKHLKLLINNQRYEMGRLMRARKSYFIPVIKVDRSLAFYTLRSEKYSGPWCMHELKKDSDIIRSEDSSLITFCEI